VRRKRKLPDYAPGRSAVWEQEKKKKKLLSNISKISSVGKKKKKATLAK